MPGCMSQARATSRAHCASRKGSQADTLEKHTNPEPAKKHPDLRAEFKSKSSTTNCTKVIKISKKQKQKRTCVKSSKKKPPEAAPRRIHLKLQKQVPVKQTTGEEMMRIMTGIQLNLLIKEKEKAFRERADAHYAKWS